MTYISQTVLLALFLTSHPAAAQERSYAHPGIGLTLSYGPEWTVVQNAAIVQALESAAREDIPTEDVSEAIPHIDFSIAKSARSGGQVSTSNLMLMVIPVPAGECDALNTAAYTAAEAKDYLSSLPGARLAPERDMPVAGTRTYTVMIPLRDRVATQHRYMYCVNGHYVLMQTTSSLPEGESGLQDILRTVRIREPGRP